ncbi:LD-carboxypeptidase [Jiella sp. M17.18]|uniref:S66 peptidase family protein n=1 Tax=Jiella sp. M17.18 TaxID=3234247 RepID=UPI0034DE12F6
MQTCDTRPLRTPRPLAPGDTVRLVSPASPPEREAVEQAADILRSWGLVVTLGDHVFDRYGFLAGTDDNRLADLNAALRDPTVRAIVATRGGKGSYRIADSLDFAAAVRDPKWLVGFSDITILQLALFRHGGIASVHGALYPGGEGRPAEETTASLRHALFSGEPQVVLSRPEEPTARLTTGGVAEGPLVGGNLEMIATAAGWALPDLAGAILLIEQPQAHPGQIDRPLTMLRKAGHLDGLAGVAVGQLEGPAPRQTDTILAILADHLSEMDVPVLGGPPIGHGRAPVAVRTGRRASIDGTKGTSA